MKIQIHIESLTPQTHITQILGTKFSQCKISINLLIFAEAGASIETSTKPVDL
jgi:hypothetical protein